MKLRTRNLKNLLMGFVLLVTQCNVYSIWVEINNAMPIDFVIQDQQGDGGMLYVRAESTLRVMWPDGWYQSSVDGDWGNNFAWSAAPYDDYIGGYGSLGSNPQIGIYGGSAASNMVVIDITQSQGDINVDYARRSGAKPRLGLPLRGATDDAPAWFTGGAISTSSGGCNLVTSNDVYKCGGNTLYQYDYNLVICEESDRFVFWQTAEWFTGGVCTGMVIFGWGFVLRIYRKAGQTTGAGGELP